MQKYWKGAVEGMTEDPEGQVRGWGGSLTVILTASRSTAFPPAVAPSSLVSGDGACSSPPGGLHHSRQASLLERPARLPPLRRGKAALPLGFSPGVPQIILYLIY